MSNFKKISIKISLFTIFILIISAACMNSYAYNMTNIVYPKEELRQDVTKFPDMIYRKQTAAYYTTINQYKNAKKYDARAETGNLVNGWYYYYPNGGYNIKEVALKSDKNLKVHNNEYSFDRRYEYFHTKPNSIYLTQKGKDNKYYSTGEIRVSDVPKITTTRKGSYYNIESESSSYQGIYWKYATKNKKVSEIDEYEQNKNIYVFENNIYRYAILGR